MKIVNVIPLSRGISKETLSYLSPSDIPAGSIVSVPLRSRSIPALVVGSKDVEEMRMELRSSAFAVKKVQRVLALSLFSSSFVSACEESADWFASTTGAVMSSLVPKALLDNVKKLRPSSVPAPAGQFEKVVLQSHDEERLSHYKSLIREEFARGRSVFFLLPTVEDIRRMKPLLEKGIDAYAYALHSKLKPKDTVDAANEILSSKHPVLIVGTAQYLSLHRPDIKTIIIEKEASRHYKTPVRPHLDIRIFAEKLARKQGAKLVLGDRLLRTETVHEARASEHAELFPMKFRLVSTAKVSLIDMRKEEDGKKQRFRIFSDALEETVRRTKDNNENMLLFGARKGYATQSVCADCGETVRCANCGAPATLYMLSAEENYFFCNRCGEKRDARERCRNCSSWNIDMLGIGVERIEEELHARFPTLKVFRLDKESVTTEKRALEVIEKFNTTPGSVLVGTELALLYLGHKVDNTAVVSIDSLFAVPDFRIGEKLFHILLALRDLAEREFIIQTRNFDERVFTYAAQGNLMDFYRDEIEARKRFMYPPFSLFIRITLEGARQAVEARMRKLKTYLEPYQADLVPSFDTPGAKKFQMHAILKVKTEEWPDAKLLEKLRALPPHYSIRIDPDTLI